MSENKKRTPGERDRFQEGEDVSKRDRERTHDNERAQWPGRKIHDVVDTAPPPDPKPKKENG
jgi:hypothetical protein